MTVRVLTALDHRIETSVSTALERVGEVTVVRRCADLPDLLAAAAAGLADVAVISPGLRFLDRDALDRLAHAGVAVVGVVTADAAGEEDERRLRQLGVAYVVPADDDAGILQATLLDLGSDGPAAVGNDEPEPEATLSGIGVRRGRVLAVWGPGGSPGRTTVAVALAAALAQDRQVLLVDADTWGASIAQSLAIVDEAPGILAAARAADQGTLDRPVLARVAPRAPHGFRVLTGVPRADRWPELRPLALVEVLKVARTLADVVIVDVAAPIEDDEELSYDTTAPRRNGAALAALEESDELLVVGAADPVGLQRLVRAVQDVAGRPTPAPRVVVNKVRESAVGSRPERTIADALGRFSGLTELDFLPWEPATCDAALLGGDPVPVPGTKSPLGGGLAQLADHYRAILAAHEQSGAALAR